MTTLIKELPYRELTEELALDLDLRPERLFRFWGFDVGREIIYKNYPNQQVIVFMQPVNDDEPISWIWEPCLALGEDL